MAFVAFASLPVSFPWFKKGDMKHQLELCPELGTPYQPKLDHLQQNAARVLTFQPWICQILILKKENLHKLLLHLEHNLHKSFKRIHAPLARIGSMHLFAHQTMNCNFNICAIYDNSTAAELWERWWGTVFVLMPWWNGFHQVLKQSGICNN